MIRSQEALLEKGHRLPVLNFPFKILWILITKVMKAINMERCGLKV